METLAVETTTNIISLALHGDDKDLLTVSMDGCGQGVVTIFTLLQDLLDMGGLSVKDIGRVAVNVGPGDFTGSRIGVIFAKTFSLIAGISLYGFNTLEVMVSGMETADKGLIMPVLDVRRGYCYFCGFRKAGSINHDGGFGLTEVFKPDFEKIENLRARLITIPGEKMILIQKGRRDSLLKNALEGMEFIEGDLISAAGLISALPFFNLSEIESDPHEVLPVYPANFELFFKGRG